jgi:hypothetical protein
MSRLNVMLDGLPTLFVARLTPTVGLKVVTGEPPPAGIEGSVGMQRKPKRKGSAVSVKAAGNQRR